MSLVTDMLKKLQSGEPQGNVPPGLQRMVLESGRKKGGGSRYQMISLLVVGVLALGVGSLYLPDLLGGTEKKTLKPQAAQVQLPAAVAPAQPIPQPALKPEAPASKTLPEVEVAVAPLEKKEARETATRPAVSRHAKVAVKGVVTASAKPAFSAKPLVVAAKPSVPVVTAPPVAPEDPKQSPKVDQERVDLLLYAARSFESRRDYRSALDNYRKALALDGDNYLVMNNMAGVLIAMGAHPEAATHAKQALGIRNDYVPALINLGIAQIKSGDKATGEGCLTRALTIEPYNRQALLNLALLQERERELAGARDSFGRLAALGDVQGNLGMARVAEAEGKKTLAARAYREASARELDAKTRKMVNERIVLLEK